MTARTLDTRTVAGLPVTIWNGTGPTVVALAGLGSPGISWAPVVDRLGDAHVVAPDLRGRGDAQGMTGPTGLRAHAQDVARILDELDLEDVVLLGHSYGSYLSPVVAQVAPGRIRKLVLVDGGIPPKFPGFMGPRLMRIAFGKKLRSVDRDYPSIEAAMKKARMGTMLTSSPELQPELERILVDSCTSTFRPRLDVDRAVEDAVDAFFGPAVPPALAALTVPADVILATSKEREGQGPFITDKAAEPWLKRQPLLRVQRVKGNHVTVLFAPEVAAAVLAP
jgi:pimeloyl-ACP methyl ester carboxylesterase